MSRAELANSSLMNVSDERRRRLVKEFLEEPVEPRDSALERINKEIAWLENDTGMTTDVMLDLLRNGRIRETETYCHWLLLLSLRKRLEAVPSNRR
jgi:hypothetical protein